MKMAASSSKQPSGYHFQLCDETTKNYQCSICLNLIRQAMELPCSHMMCKLCLEHYEAKRLEENQEGGFHCSTCQLRYEPNQKKVCDTIDQKITTSIKVRCKGKKKGCNWIGTIIEYKYHKKLCDFLVVSCEYEECLEKAERSRMEEHHQVCQFRPIKCEYCHQALATCRYEQHKTECYNYPVRCKNEECSELVQRRQTDIHCFDECLYQVIQCPYNGIGCQAKIIRKDIENHEKEAALQHMRLLLKNQTMLSQNNAQLEQQLIKANQKIASMEDTALRNSEIIKIQRRNITELEETLHSEMHRLEDLLIIQESNIDRHEDKLMEFKIFAETSANLQFLLSDPIALTDYPFCSTLHHEDYMTNQWAKNWQIEVNRQHTIFSQVQYKSFRLLQKATKNYQIYHYSTKYHERIQTFYFKMTSNVFYTFEGRSIMKLPMFYTLEKVHVELTNKMQYFQLKIQKENWVTLSMEVAVRINEDRCLFLLVQTRRKDAYLLHCEHEEKMKKLELMTEIPIKDVLQEFLISRSLIFEFK